MDWINMTRLTKDKLRLTIPPGYAACRLEIAPAPTELVLQAFLSTSRTVRCRHKVTLPCKEDSFASSLKHSLAAYILPRQSPTRHEHRFRPLLGGIALQGLVVRKGLVVHISWEFPGPQQPGAQPEGFSKPPVPHVERVLPLQ